MSSTESLKGVNNALSRTWEETMPGTCDETSCADALPKTYTFRSVPEKIQMIARTIPQTDGRIGTEAAHLVASIERKEQDSISLCDVLGTAFGLAEMVPKFGEIAGAGGFIAETVCGIVEGSDD